MKTRASLLLLASSALALHVACGASQGGGKAAGRDAPVKTSHGTDFPWQTQAGPIRGRWTASCEPLAGTVIEFVVDAGDANPSPGDVFNNPGRDAAIAQGYQPSLATGRIAKLAGAESRQYEVGEVVLELESTMVGKWVGRIKTRTVRGESKWDPIQFAVDGDRAEAVVTNSRCWQTLSRVK